MIPDPRAALRFSNSPSERFGYHPSILIQRLIIVIAMQVDNLLAGSRAQCAHANFVRVRVWPAATKLPVACYNLSHSRAATRLRWLKSYQAARLPLTFLYNLFCLSTKPGDPRRAERVSEFSCEAAARAACGCT